MLNIFQSSVFLMLIVSMLSACSPSSDTDHFDIVIKGARVIDPETKFDAIANIGIVGKKIAVITSDNISGSNVVVANGLVAAPGFIDLHFHGQDPFSERVGVFDGKTTQLDLEAGAMPVADYYHYKSGKSLTNYGASVGHAFARVQAMDGINSQGIGLLNHTLEKTAQTGNKWASQTATEQQLNEIDELIIGGLAQGGLGVGIMVGYYPNARSDGLTRIAKIAKNHNSFLTVHSRYLSLTQPSGMLGIQEMISLATSYDVPLLIHHVPTNALSNTKTVLDMIDEANRNGAKIVGEMFPYDRGSTFIGTEILDEGWQERMDMDYHDLTWTETGETLTEKSFNQYRSERPEGYFIMKHIKEEDMLIALNHPSTIIGSDGMVYTDSKGQLLPKDAPVSAGLGHPRGAGSYGRFLRLAIDGGSLSLMNALAKTSYLPAMLVEKVAPEMKDRGRLQQGAFADITIFDPKVVDGVAGYAQGTNSLPSKGFPYVIVNGEVVIDNGKLINNTYPGQAVRGQLANK